jgi:hypothetical protein
MSRWNQPRKWLQLLGGAILLYIFWGHVCPWVLSWPFFAAHEKLVREQQIRVGAIFYTELDHYPGKPSP